MQLQRKLLTTTGAPHHNKNKYRDYVQKHQTARLAHPPHGHQENSASSPLCCQKVNRVDVSLQSFSSNRAPGPRSSLLSTSRCTFVSSRV